MTVVRGLHVVAILCLVGTATFAQGKPASTTSKAPAAPAASKAAAPVHGLGSARDIMEALTIPMSDAVFAAGSEAPKDDAGWAAVHQKALVLAESANLLLIPPRVITSGTWTKWAVAQRDAAVQAMKAAKAKNGDALSDAGNALYETCEGCHKVYLPSK
jgi:hypothetical protein